MQTTLQRLKPIHFLLILVIWIFLASPANAVAPAYTPKVGGIVSTSAKPAVIKDVGQLVLVNKQHSLPAGYVPGNLVMPKVPFYFQGYHSKKLMHKEAAVALEELFGSAGRDGIGLYAASGYRSYEHQRVIFTTKERRMGTVKANRFSARPGQSEHQTGLAMDVTSRSVKFELIQRFGDTREGKWLRKNAANAGFIIRYPKGKEAVTGYQYEPWHLRYVGKAAAKEMTAKNLTLEEYLGRK